MFEVGMCVMCYVTVLYIEFVPVFCEGFMGDGSRPRLARACTLLHGTAEKVMPLFIVLGVGISCLHQSSLGHVMVLTPTKLHPLWYTPVLSLMFLVSAIAAGFPTAIVISLLSSWAMKRKPDMVMLGRLARYVPIFLALTHRRGPAQMKRLALQTTLTALGVIVGFALFGQIILAYLTLSLPPLQAAAGLSLHWVGRQP